MGLVEVVCGAGGRTLHAVVGAKPLLLERAVSLVLRGQQQEVGSLWGQQGHGCRDHLRGGGEAHNTLLIIHWEQSMGLV